MRTRCKDVHDIVHHVPIMYSINAVTTCRLELVWNDHLSPFGDPRSAWHTEEKVNCLACLATFTG